MKLIIRTYYVVAFMLFSGACYCQDINFSQFSELPLLRNPAIAGIFSGDVRVTAAYRNQWQSVTNPYRTMALGGERKFSLGENSDDFLTVGLQLTDDVAGDSRLSKIQLLPVINFHKSVGRNAYLSAGIMAGAVQQRFDPGKLQFDDQFVNGAYSPANPTRQTYHATTLIYADAAAGLSFSSSIAEDVRYYVGAGIFHFTKPKVAFLSTSDITLNEKWVVNAGLSKTLSEENTFVFYGDLFMQGGNTQVQGGFLWSHDLVKYDEDQKIAIAFGSFYRFKDAIIPTVKLDYYNLSVGVSYDVNISKLTVASGMRGGTEITLAFVDFLKSSNSSLNRQRCPGF